MSEWRPISEAPRDGEMFLAYTNRGKHIVGHYMDVPRFGKARGRAHAVLDPWAGRWYRADFWMPLPPPPETGQ